MQTNDICGLLVAGRQQLLSKPTKIKSCSHRLPENLLLEKWHFQLSRHRTPGSRDFEFASIFSSQEDAKINWRMSFVYILTIFIMQNWYSRKIKDAAGGYSYQTSASYRISKWRHTIGCFENYLLFHFRIFS